MRMRDTLTMAFVAIARNKVRSVLTALGIVIGVASVIAMVHLGQAATRSVTESISSMGSNLLIVQTGRGRGRGGVRGAATAFTHEDVELMARQIPGVLVAPQANTQATLVYGGINHAASVMGTTNDFFTIRNWALERGRLFDPEEQESAATVCVIGHTVATTMFGSGEPLGQTLRVGRSACQIIGVLASKGASLGQDLDDVVVMPTLAVQRRLIGNLDVRSIYVSALVDGSTARVKADIERFLRERRPDAGEDSFYVRDMQEIADTLAGTTRTLTLLLGAIAAVSLLVGGIGIMNIMLVSVTERTREIGIRIAIGARVRDVLVQFLVEAVAISTLGGLIGVMLGVGGTYIATSKMGLPFVLSTETMLVGFGFSAIIGVVFGFVPARKAARLNPIEALRHE
ncbi:FtsX-like permease family protein [Lujinxingia vulgaris]|uniref:FtsX-like permease family protein n=1 Tax=Lujinxingia vulgaris TaxID=2600176 RepID=A0A5C6WVU5_9DELT|nr:ABC transporter permease [Lujinxingia vulgaris]TXD33093.1 FtsX-like permease family protein [Lujinxingia vulgaris]